MRALEARSGAVARRAQERAVAVARERGEGPRRRARRVPHPRGDGGRLAAPVVGVVLDQAIGLPHGEARAQQGVPHGFGWNVDEGDGPPQCRGEGRRHLGVRQRLGAGEVVGPALVAGLGQRRGGGGGDVAHVHDADPGVAGRREEPALGRDGGAEGEQALHEEVGPQEGVGDSGRRDRALDRGVVAQEAHRGALVRGELRELDEVLQPGAARGVHEGALLRFRPLRGGGEEERLLDPAQGAPDRRRIVEIARDDLDPGQRGERIRPLGRTDHGAHGDAAGREELGEFGPVAAGGARDEDHRMGSGGRPARSGRGGPMQATRRRRRAAGGDVVLLRASANGRRAGWEARGMRPLARGRAWLPGHGTALGDPRAGGFALARPLRRPSLCGAATRWFDRLLRTWTFPP